MLEKRLEQALQKRETDGNLRSLSVSEAAVDFSSNDYLGLSRSQLLADNIEDAWQAYRQNGSDQRLNGATGSRLLSGNSALCQAVEAELAEWLQAEAVLLFPTGFQANVALVSCLPAKNDGIVYDELVHASMREGYRLAVCSHRSFRHNDMAHLAERLEATRKAISGNLLVMAESVYSMDGDVAPLGEMLEVCHHYGASLIYDEAHSTGLFHENGSGMACALGLAAEVFARVYTFGKAPGIHGACVAGSRLLKEYLVNFSRGFIYSTALSPHCLLTIRESVRMLQTQLSAQKKLLENIGYFKTNVAATALADRLMPSESAIQALLVSGNDRCKSVAAFLQSNGLDVRPVLSPTVPAGKERLRIILHAFNTFAEIDGLIAALLRCQTE